MGKLDGKRAMVFGGAGLIGFEMCKALAKEGATVFMQDVDFEKAKHLSNSLVEQGLSCKAVYGDITKPEQLASAVGIATSFINRLDIVAIPAAINPQPGESGGHLETYPLDKFRQSLEVNLLGTFAICQAVIGRMVEGGSIITVGSTYGMVSPDQRMYGDNRKPPDYTATKGGVIALTKWLAVYLAPKGIRVNCLIPGGVFNNQDVGFVKMYENRTPMGRMADAFEIGEAVVYLATASYMTGANLVVDGGFTAW